MPRLMLQRVPDRYGRYGKMSVYIDGIFVDVIRSGELKDFVVNPGSHTLRIKKMWLASKPLEFNIDDKKCTCGPIVNGWAHLLPFITYFILIFWCRRSLFIEMEQQKNVEFETEFR